MVPMLFMWTGVWAVLAAFAFVNFQREGLTVLSALGAIGERLSWLPRPGPLGTPQPDGSITFDGRDVQKLVATYWGVLSAALYLLTMLIARLRGPQPPMPLRVRLRIAAWLGLATLVAFLALYTLSAQPFQGSTATWVMIFLALSVLPVVVSVYSLTVTRAIDRVRDALLGDHPFTAAIVQTTRQS